MSEPIKNPFPLTAKDEIDPLIAEQWNAWEEDRIKALQEVAELAKWIIAHGHVDDKGRFKICITLSNPHELAPELLVLNAMRGNPL